MWARIVEFMLALWLAISAFIFGHEFSILWNNDILCAILITLFAFLSYHPKLSKIHLLNVLIGFWLIGFGYVLDFSRVPAGLENDILIGILLLMLGIIPNHCTEPPKAWKAFLTKKEK